METILLAEQVGIGKLKEQARIRDNYACQTCGKMQQEGERKLDVHHIDGKDNCLTSLDRLITLCHACHFTLHPKQLKARNRRTKRRYGENCYRQWGMAGGNPILLKVRDDKINHEAVTQAG